MDSFGLEASQVADVKIITDKAQPHISKGYAYVDLASSHLLKEVIDKCK